MAAEAVHGQQTACALKRDRLSEYVFLVRPTHDCQADA
jgi:hypothetical protein